MVGLSGGLTSIGLPNFGSPFAGKNQSGKGSASADDTGFPDLSVSTSPGPGVDNRASQQSVVAAANAAAIDVDGLRQFAKEFGSNADHATIGIETIGRDGRVIAGATLDGDGDLSVFGSASANDSSTTLGMTLSAAGGGDWQTISSQNLARASYALNSLIAQEMANMSGSSVTRLA